ncbi:hypothetical protein SBI_00856 [Streptomyces bingchenggensis BCW-1]|uniref:Uncharacterized protein n=1 Tax=Streptomyces bingchenggensis (strain BCW-1) TaxID=749414 RepID=D7C4F5_STRBB|nr:MULTISPECIES: hypothetical protein [Streptomyces]ADI03977.1 hypothetical protein SBI_00856 [Streptomyces bingchenggensis BCW-1]
MAGYFDHHGIAQRADGDRVTADLPSGDSVDIDFDTAGRIAHVSLKVSP